MKIAHVLWSMKTGGTENMVTDIASIQSQTEEVALFVINNEIEQYMVERVNPKVKLYLIKREPGSKNPWPFIKFNYLMKLFNPDIIHQHSTNTIYCLKVCKKTPQVRTIHGLDNPPKEYSLYKRIYAISDAVKAITKERGYDSITIWNGINTEKISSSKKNLFVDGLYHFVQVGRLLKNTKGQDVVISAIKILKDRKINNFRMHFIGNGESEKELIEQVKVLGLEDLIKFEGRVPQQDIYKTLTNYDLFILASRREGFGLTIAEAMIAKVPVLVSDLDATMEVIRNGELGTYFRTGDSLDLADKIEKFMEEGVQQSQIEAAYQFAIDNYDIKSTANRYMLEYKAIIK